MQLAFTVIQATKLFLYGPHVCRQNRTGIDYGASLPAVLLDRC